MFLRNVYFRLYASKRVGKREVLRPPYSFWCYDIILCLSTTDSVFSFLEILQIGWQRVVLLTITIFIRDTLEMWIAAGDNRNVAVSFIRLQQCALNHCTRKRAFIRLPSRIIPRTLTNSRLILGVTNGDFFYLSSKFFFVASKNPVALDDP